MKINHDYEMFGNDKPTFILTSYYPESNIHINKIFGAEEHYLDFLNLDNGYFKQYDKGVWRIKYKNK